MTYTFIRVDKEVVEHITTRKGADSRNKYLRRLLGLPPLKENRGWPKGKRRTLAKK